VREQRRGHTAARGFAVSLLISCSAFWSVSAAIAPSQNANASASALTNSALVTFFSLPWAGLGLATPLRVAQLVNWLSAW